MLLLSAVVFGYAELSLDNYWETRLVLLLPEFSVTELMLIESLELVNFLEVEKLPESVIIDEEDSFELIESLALLSVHSSSSSILNTGFDMFASLFDSSSLLPFSLIVVWLRYPMPDDMLRPLLDEN